MSKMEFTTKVQRLGRIVIPKAKRELLKIEQGDIVRVEILEIKKVRYEKPGDKRLI